MIRRYGLPEIKCPNVEKVSSCQYLKLLLNGNLYFLKKFHEYSYQIMGQVDIAGCEWCDFFVISLTAYHKESIFLFGFVANNERSH